MSTAAATTAVAGAVVAFTAVCCAANVAAIERRAPATGPAEPEPEPEPELEPEPEGRSKPKPKKAGQYFDSDFPYSSVVEEGAAAVRGHGEFLPPARGEALEAEAAAKWDDFYRRHAAKFFKPRNYLLHCFPELAEDDGDSELSASSSSASPSEGQGQAQRQSSRRRLVLEVGCGAGDTAFSLLELNPSLRVLASDFSATGVATTKASPLYAKHAAAGRCEAFVWDLTQPELPQEVAQLEGQVDAVVAVFVLSAIAPEKHAGVVARLVRLLRPGTGVALFRDYGRCASPLHALTRSETTWPGLAWPGLSAQSARVKAQSLSPSMCVCGVCGLHGICLHYNMMQV